MLIDQLLKEDFKMKFFKYMVLAVLIAFPVSTIAGPGPPIATQSIVQFTTKDFPDQEAFAYYDLRDRRTYIQVSNIEDEVNPLCIHVQIFQQDQGCSELDFNDELTPNDTVIYDMDNLVRNNGTDIPVNLDDDSYGFVAISAVNCSTNSDGGLSDPLIGNVRIIDDSGYEYRMNLLNDAGLQATDRWIQSFIVPGFLEPADEVLANIVIPFNTVDGANQADIVAFITEDNRNLAGVADEDDGPEPTPDQDDDLVYNEEIGISFSVFLLDEDEERLSCDRKTFGCGPNVVLNYGVNEDYPASRGDNLLCEGGGLLPGQEHGYISLENPTFLSPIDNVIEPPLNSFEFVCLVGLNNGDNTGSMDSCTYKCIDTDDDSENDPYDCNTFIDDFGGG